MRKRGRRRRRLRLKFCWALSTGTEYALYYSDAVIAEAGPAGIHLMYNTVYSR